ncbi:ABC transporter ATP-binding protein [Aquisalibacillus elongatus]|uniref:Carnitine transport ATP-binding protein OpuCA n=1 Tax=Aquisalibacillus elongatus TaxID=485577 RepID=A0A3N5B944_9BACI|nr:ABC transporter ATP-binding protein [Aquisalibacillus elongatus]RPF53499.1 iron(III) transport system ATP-binding protein/putative spermidine/putrescine transport system ATP-binding protein/spermidine/putrescine transport system ATP-binding protein [Aquisalibacillus elongatus]
MSGHENFLKLSHLYKYFGDVKAVNDISIDIEQGELISFIGPSGCGKTTLLRIVGGFHKQDQGSITLDDQAIDQLPPEQRPTGMVFQNYALFPHMTVYKNVEYGLKIEKVDKAEREKRIKEALAQVQLEGYEERKPSELSGGQQQRVAIARCLVLKPKVLLLDEPLSNLDANLRMIMREEIRRLKEELNLTIIFVTHDQEEALSISDRVIVLKDGTVQQLDRPDNIYNEPSNEFVANFVGHANILSGNLAEVDGDTYFKTGKFSFKVEQPSNTTNQDVKAVIRPERIKLDPEGQLEGKIARIVYNGNFTRYFVDIQGEEIMVDDFNAHGLGSYQRNDQIKLSFPDQPHYILEEDVQ